MRQLTAKEIQDLYNTVYNSVFSSLGQAIKPAPKNGLPSNNYFNINSFINDGFQRVADVHCQSTTDQWLYYNIDQNLMYADHESWVYFVVIDDQIVKCGETGNKLALRYQTKNKRMFLGEEQPITGTKGRFGRLASHKEDKNSGRSETDEMIRRECLPYLIRGSKVSLWAKKCQYGQLDQIINGVKTSVTTTIHKDLELKYLKSFKAKAGRLPLFNKAKK
jgi:hypothetical protein